MANRPYLGFLVEEVRDRTGLTKKDARNVINAMTDTIKQTLSKGEKVTLVGFGTFQVIKRKARIGRNPQTGATIQIPAKRVAKFLPGKAMKGKIG